MRRILVSAVLLGLSMPVLAESQACRQNKVLEERDIVLTLPTSDGAKSFRMDFNQCFDEGPGAVRVYASFDTTYQLWVKTTLDGDRVSITLAQRRPPHMLQPLTQFDDLTVSALIEQSVTWPDVVVRDIASGKEFKGPVTVSAQPRR